MTVRRYGVEEQKVLAVDGLVAMLEEEIRERRHVRRWD